MLATRLAALGRAVQTTARRNFGVSAVALQKADPIQQLFLDKLKEYKTKNLTKDISTDAEMLGELERLKGMYKVQKNEDMTKLDMPQYPEVVLGAYDLGIETEAMEESAQ